MTIYISEFWLGFATGMIVFFLLLSALVIWTNGKKKTQGEKNGD